MFGASLIGGLAFFGGSDFTLTISPQLSSRGHIAQGQPFDLNVPCEVRLMGQPFMRSRDGRN